MLDKKLDINEQELKKAFDEQPVKKKALQSVFQTDRTTICKMLNGKRRIEAGEYLTMTKILEVPPYTFIR